MESLFSFMKVRGNNYPPTLYTILNFSKEVNINIYYIFTKPICYLLFQKIFQVDQTQKNDTATENFVLLFL